MIRKKESGALKYNVFSQLLVLCMVLCMLLICLSNYAFAMPPLPTEFYGTVRAYNLNASPGEVVSAYDGNGILCGDFRVVNTGFYGTLTCRGDDPETSVDEGAISGENISFRLRGGFTTIIGNYTWGAGVFQYVNLTYPVVFCGDGFCDALYENSFNCLIDCPLNNGTINYTYNQTNTTYNDTNQTGGTGGAGQGSGGETGGQDRTPPSISQLFSNHTGINMSEQEGFGFTCTELWSCGNWSECGIDGFQNRTCVDKNNCNTFEKKPAEVQKCVYSPTCFDGVKNGLEEGIDCGGLCPPCINCFDGIQNCHDGSCEDDVDCGGPCQKCPTCFDGIQNCHDGSCENGVDCGGPCEKICPQPQTPGFTFLCKKDFNPLSNQSILFFLVILVVILGDIIYSQRKIKEVIRNKRFSDIKRARTILSIRRRMYLFIFIVALISLILYLYYYFFIMCEVNYRFLWLLLVILFASPILIHEVIRYLEYTENKRLSKLELLLETHYKQIETLVRIENENLMELEEEIAYALFRLLERPEYKRKENLSGFNLLKDTYSQLVTLYSKYKNKDNPISNEKILCDDIYKLAEDPIYQGIIEQDINLKQIVTKLKLLYKQYEEKQKFYDEMSNIELSMAELKNEIKESK